MAEALRILLIEDNPGDARLVREALREASELGGSSVSYALTVVERLTVGLSRLAAESFDVVLLDLDLPDAHGYESFERLRAAFPRCTVVVLTRHDDDSLGAQAIREGAQDYLTKADFQGAALARSLRYARERRQAEDDREQLLRADEEAARQASALAAAERKIAAQRLLAESSALLVVPFRAAETLAKLAEALVPTLADAATLTLSEETPAVAPGWSCLVMPLLRGTTVHGRLALARKPERAPFDEEDRALADDLAQRVVLALESARLFDLAQHERARAEAASRAKDQFLGVVSHELRTPLNAILGWAQLLRGGGLDAAATHRALDTIDRNARAQAKLIEDILDVSRVISGKLRLDLAPTNVADVVEAAVDAVLPSAQAKGARLVSELDRSLVISADAARLQQIVWNLLTNAVRFVGAGGEVRVRAVSARGFVELTVQDDGQGIEPAFLPHVFESFRQEDASSTRRHGGLGLGLAIVRHLTELHGGTASASSDGHGAGATFSIQLPLRAPPRREEGGSFAPPPPPALDPSTAKAKAAGALLPGVRVLVVDDQEDVRDLLQVILEDQGARVTVAGSVAEALAQFDLAPPDVLLSDIGMPGEDGYSLINQVRALSPAQGGQVPAVAVTAFARSDDRLRALREGYDEHVTKPLDPLGLVLLVREAMARAR